MAEIAEGFSINATLVLNSSASSYVIGDIKQPKVKLSEDSTLAQAYLALDVYDSLNTLGEIKRSNNGSQGFSVKAAVLLNDSDDSFSIADISHAKCRTTDETNTTNASLELDNYDLALYLGDFKRSNSGNQGFTIKSYLSIDNKADSYYFADISHGRCVIKNDEGNLLAELTLDNGSFEHILGDFTRANKGQQGFTLSSKVILDRPDTNEILADIFRKNDPKYESTARILAYNGRYYLIYTNDCLHYFITKTGDE